MLSFARASFGAKSPNEPWQPVVEIVIFTTNSATQNPNLNWRS